MIRIENRVQFENIPDGSILHLFLTGDGWENDCARSVKVVKSGMDLYEIKDRYEYAERLEKEYEFDIWK